MTVGIEFEQPAEFKGAILTITAQHAESQEAISHKLAFRRTRLTQLAHIVRMNTTPPLRVRLLETARGFSQQFSTTWRPPHVVGFDIRPLPVATVFRRVGRLANHVNCNTTAPVRQHTTGDLHQRHVAGIVFMEL